jgi:hypothetical protein
MFTLVKSTYSLNITNIFGGGHHSWLITDNIMPEREDIESPSPLASPNLTPLNSPRGKDHSNTDLIKITVDNSRLNMTGNRTQKPLITNSLKYTLDMFAEKITANKSLFQIAYTDLKMSHRFVRFSMNPNGRYRDLTYKQVNSLIGEYLASDPNVILFRLQDDNDVSNFKNQAMDHVFKDFKTNFKILEGLNNKKNSYSLTIVYDIEKNRDIAELRDSLESNRRIRKNEKKFLCNFSYKIRRNC